MLSPTLRLECRLETETLDLARESLYRFLAAALSDPRSRAFSAVLNVDNQVMAAAGAELLREEAQNDPVPLGFGERPLGDLDLRDALAEIRRPLDGAIICVGANTQMWCFHCSRRPQRYLSRS